RRTWPPPAAVPRPRRLGPGRARRADQAAAPGDAGARRDRATAPAGAAGFPDRRCGRTCADAVGVRAYWSSIVVRGRVMFEDVHGSIERLPDRNRTAHTSDHAGCSPARVAGNTAVASVRPGRDGVFPP